jgi:hypothetical protein
MCSCKVILFDRGIDRDELIDTCVAVLHSMNASDEGSREQLMNKCNEPVVTIPDDGLRASGCTDH